MSGSHSDRAIAHLRKIGLAVQIEVGAKGFIPGVQIRAGGLAIDPGAPVSSVLHEAGHLAICPSIFRRLLNDDITDGLEAAFATLPDDCWPDEPIYRALIQCSDPEATAWAWAAGMHLGIPDEMIIMDDEYEGGGAEVRAGLAATAYCGINGLAHAGFCSTNRHGRLPVFPELAFWLQDAAP